MDTRTGNISYQTIIDSMAEEERQHFKPIERPLLKKEIRKMKIDPYSPCGCGSGKKFKFCCYAPGKNEPIKLNGGGAQKPGWVNIHQGTQE